MTVYITKYALTEGIITLEGARIPSASPGMIIVPNGRGGDDYFHGEGRDWHRDLDSARVRANAIRVKKLAALRKQIKKLESISF